MPAAEADTGRAEPQSPGQPQITDDLVKKVADKVFALLLLELRIEQERRRQPRQGTPSPIGGR
jgi:hypothetical protein